MIDVNDKLDYFNETVLELLNRHAPLVPVKDEPGFTSRKPWFTDDSKQAITERDVEYAACKNGVVARANYTQLRNTARKMIRQAKENYMKPKLDLSLGTRTIWKNLRAVGIVSSSQVKSCFTADEYNVYLTSNPSTHSKTVTTLNESIPVDKFSFMNVTSADTARIIHTIKSRVIGTDQIPLTFVKIILPFMFILPVLTQLVNFCLTSSRIPNYWKMAKIIQNHKRTRSREDEDFRALSILPCLSKLLKIVAMEQLVCYLKRKDLQNLFQSGFRSKHSTDTALLRSHT